MKGEMKKMKIRKIFRRRILGPITLLHLIVLSTVSVVFGAVMLHYDWTLNLTASVPDVRFYKWSDSTQSNTLTLPYNIYADVWTIDDNATYGIKNNAGSAKTVYLTIDSYSSTSEIANLTIQILEDTGLVLCTFTTDMGSYSEVSWTAGANGVDTIKVMIKGASTVANVNIGLRLRTSE